MRRNHGLQSCLGVVRSSIILCNIEVVIYACYRRGRMMLFYWWLSGLAGCFLFRYLDNKHWATMGLPDAGNHHMSVGGLLGIFLISCAGLFVYAAVIAATITLIIISKPVKGILARRLW